MPIEIRELIINARVEPDAVSRPPRKGQAQEECDCSGGVDADGLARLLRDREER
jgi:hypothetical protein